MMTQETIKQGGDETAWTSLVFNKQISRKDAELHPEIYTLHRFSEKENANLLKFLEILDCEEYFECIASYCPQDLNAYVLFLRNKYREINNPCFVKVGALLLTYILYWKYDIDLDSIFDLTKTNIWDRYDNDGDIESKIQDRSVKILLKANAFGEHFNCPLMPVPLKKCKRPTRNGIGFLPWDYVTFLERKVKLISPYSKGQVLREFVYTEWQSHNDLNCLKKYFNRVPMIKVRMEKGRIIEVIDKIDIKKYVGSISNRTKKKVSRFSLDDLTIYKNVSQSCNVSYITLNELRDSVGKDQRYIDYLAERQLDGYKIIRYKEMNNNQEWELGFAFTISVSTNLCCVVFENLNESRSSLIFRVSIHNYENDIKSILDYFSSSTKNKRERLINRTYIQRQDGSVINFRRKFHSDYYSWSNSRF